MKIQVRRQRMKAALLATSATGFAILWTSWSREISSRLPLNPWVPKTPLWLFPMLATTLSARRGGLLPLSALWMSRTQWARPSLLSAKPCPIWINTFHLSCFRYSSHCCYMAWHLPIIYQQSHSFAGFPLLSAG